MVRDTTSSFNYIGCIPHPRGDGPQRGKLQQGAARYSPPAWGWSEDDYLMNESQNVFPTRVGMVRWLMPSPRRDDGIPHPRGDGPNIHRGSFVRSAYSPPAWGWSGHLRACMNAAEVFPTRVGMVRSGFPPSNRPCRIPHPRGDGPTAVSGYGRRTEYSPPAWGWSVHATRMHVGWIVFPTRVGMVRGPCDERKNHYRIPHPRGDGPGDGSITVTKGTYSPPAWGWSGLGRVH